MQAFADAGLIVEAMREPLPTAPPSNYQQWQEVPLFLMARTVKAR
jgi:hypothetical protein